MADISCVNWSAETVPGEDWEGSGVDRSVSLSDIATTKITLANSLQVVHKA